MSRRHWFGRAAAEDRGYRRQVARDLRARRKLPPHEDPSAPGHVVEFVKGGQPQCGVLVCKERRWHRIRDADGKEDRVDPAKIMHVSSELVNPEMSRHEIVRALRDIDRQRERLKLSIDPYELWEVVEAEGDEWELPELADLYFAGHPGPHGEAALFRVLEEGRAFRRRGRAFLPLSAEQVEEKREEELRALEAGAWLHEAAVWLRRAADGEEAAPPWNARRAAELLAAKVLFGADHPEAEQAAELARLATGDGGRRAARDSTASPTSP